MTNLYEDKAKSGSGKEIEQKGKWAEKNSAAAQPPAKTSPKGNASSGKPAALPPAKSKPLAGKKGDKTVDPNAKTKEGKTVKQLQDEAVKKGKKPEGKDIGNGKGEAVGKTDKDKLALYEELKKELATRFKGEVDPDLAPGIIKDVRSKYQKKGLKSLKAIETKAGEYMLEAVASPRADVGHFTVRDFEIKRPRTGLI